MLPRHFKFKLRPDRDFFNRADRFFSKSFTIFHAKNENGIQVVVVVPKKVVKLASARNNLKRQIYFLLLPMLNDFKDLPYSLVIVAKYSINHLNQSKLKGELSAAFLALSKK